MDRSYVTTNGDKSIGEPINIITIAASNEKTFRKIRKYSRNLHDCKADTKKFIAVIYEVEGENYE